MGADSPKSALETEDHVPKTEHINPIKSCLIRDDLHMTAHLCSKGHLLTPALKEIWRTRAKHLLQWHAENGHKSILFTDEKIFTNQEQYNNQYNKIYAQMSLEVRSEGARGHHPSYVMVWWGSVPSGSDISSFLWERCENWCPRMCYKELWNFLTWLSSAVRNGSSRRTQLLPTRLRRLGSGCGGKFWRLSALRIGPRGVQTSTPWPITCGLFWRTWLAKSIITTWTAWRDLACSVAEIPLETVCAAIAEWPEHPKACIGAEGSHFEWHYYK